MLGLTTSATQAQTKVYGLASDYGDDKTVLIAFELGQPDPVVYNKVTFNRPVTSPLEWLPAPAIRPLPLASACSRTR